MEVHLIITDSTARTLQNLQGRVSSFNRCRMTGTLSDGRNVKVLNRHGLYRAQGLLFSTWEEHCTLTDEERETLTRYAT